MKRAGLLIIISIFSSLFAFSQKNEYIKDNVNPTAEKTLSFSENQQEKELFFAGLQEKLASNYPKALTHFEKALKLNSTNHAVLFEIANIHFEERSLEQAELYIKKALSLKSDNEWYWTLLADIYKNSNKISQLIPVLDEILKLSSQQEDHLYDKAMAYLTLDEIDKALDVYREIENKFGSSDGLNAMRFSVLMQNNRYGEIEKEINKQILAKPQEIKNYIYLSEVIVKSGNRSRAIDMLQKAKTQFPASGMLRLALADQFTASKQMENAFIELKVAFEDATLNIDEKVRIVLSFFPMFAEMKARAYANELASITVKVHPDEAKAFALQGDVLFQERKFEEALISYKKALEINGQVYQIWEQLLSIELNLGYFKDLIADGNKALTIFPNQANLYLYTGIGYAQVRNHEKAIVFLKGAIELEPSDKEIVVQIYASLGDSFNALKKYSESDDAYNRALVLDPNNSYVLNNYAYYLSLRGEKLVEAEKMSRRSIEIEANNPSFEDTYAWILFRLKRYSEAKKWIEKSIQGKPENNATQLEHYGDILYFLGDEMNAIEKWKKAKAQGGGSEKLIKKIDEKKYID
jgi:tetratricopeptide (TPR) repeat protein